MTNTCDRITVVLEETGAELPAAVVEGLRDTAARLEQTLNLWEPPSTMAADLLEIEARPQEPSDREIRLPPGLELKAARSRARPAGEGGAYTHLAAAERDLDTAEGPLAGVPFAVKDLIAVAGMPLVAGSAVRADAPVEPADALIVTRFRAAGAALVGTTSLHEFAFGVTGINQFTGTTPNPVDPERIAGGSSTGSAAAVAEGSARVAIGTDTGGSVRIPAALCGVAGFKPAYGTYPIQGVFPLAPTLDHVGLFARSVEELRHVHAALGHPLAPATRPARIGVLRRALEEAAPEVRSRLERGLEQLAARGCRLVDVEGPDADLVATASTVIMFSEAALVHRREMMAGPDRYGADVRARLVLGLSLPAHLYLRALEARQTLTAAVLQRLKTVDCLAGPTVGIVAPRLEEATDPAISAQLVRHTRLANVVGLPAVNVPVPGEGLPVGLQVMALTNERTLGVGAFVEQVFGTEG